jgi:hypothetical protein
MFAGTTKTAIASSHMDSVEELSLSEFSLSFFYSHDDLQRKARVLYRNFRKRQSTRFGLVNLGRTFRDLITRPFRPAFIDVISIQKIAFVGTWDTVDAYGLPIEEFKTGINRYLWPLALDDRTLDCRILKACHALSIDDKRTTFHPLLWDERGLPQAQSTDEESLTQVWFAGMHSDIGGGYPDSSLSSVPLLWMIRESKRHGLKFKDHEVTRIAAEGTPYGRIHDSRSGIGALYRYGPRSLNPAQDNQGAEISHPKIHESVLRRMMSGADSYAPLTLPTNIRVVVDDPGSPAAADRPTGNILSFDSFNELVAIARSRESSVRKIDDNSEEIPALELPDDQSIELIWDTVWWRRKVYFLTALVAAILVLAPVMPIVSISILDEIWKRLLIPFYSFEKVLEFMGRAVHAIAVNIEPVESVGISLLTALLPRVFEEWLGEFKRHPALITIYFCSSQFCDGGRLSTGEFMTGPLLPGT